MTKYFRFCFKYQNPSFLANDEQLVNNINDGFIRK